jgi:hypothetical protein
MGANPGTATADAVAKLQTACDEAYAKHNNSCSHAVWYVLTKTVDKDFKWLDANHLIDFLIASSDWKEVPVEDGWTLALSGIAVVGGLKKVAKVDDHGHVIAIYPGQKKASGGYSYNHKDKKSGKLVTDTMRSHGIFPPALSTSNGSWPGAKSKGEKTVWDPWANDDLFPTVKFWTRK